MLLCIVPGAAASIFLLLFLAQSASSQGIISATEDEQDSRHDVDRDVWCRVEHCSRCLNQYYCDECDPGYFLASSRREVCAPCRRGCAQCESSTTCTRCFDGFGLFDDECAECSVSGCRRCDRDVDVCQACRFFLRLTPDEKECVTNFKVVTAGFFIVSGLALLLSNQWRNRRRSLLVRDRQRNAAHEDHRAYVGDPSSRFSSIPSSGIWKGYYTQRGEQHAVLEFNLDISSADGTVRGFGVDDVGKFRIQGLHANRKIAFTKSYDGSSLNDANVRSRSNRGHSVEYRATCSEDLGAGLLGEWTIHTGYAAQHLQGTFRLWPVELAAGGTPEPAIRSSTDETGDCAVCFELRRLTRLRPCGHVAFCAECVEKLPRPRKCPLCRTRITS